MKKSTKKISKKFATVVKPIVKTRNNYKLEVLALYASGLTATQSIEKAAKKFKVKVTESMKAYPHSFMFAYKKHTSLSKSLINKLNKR